MTRIFRSSNGKFEQSIVALLMKEGLSASSSVLVVCGGGFERELLLAAGFSDVTISNLDEQYSEVIAPYRWSRQDAEHLTYDDGSFDIALVRAGLHHCYSPHRALLEMYRVARKAIVVIEARDSLLVQIGRALGFATDFELEAVSGADFKSGGVANGPIPNFVYRWTENEVFKTISSYEPRFVPRIRMFHGLNLPYYRFRKTPRRFLRALLLTLGPIVELLAYLVPKQGNQFGFVVQKTGELQPWLSRDHDGTIVTSREAVAAMHRLDSDNGRV
jgi:SAM-dependent methyltransferase